MDVPLLGMAGGMGLGYFLTDDMDKWKRSRSDAAPHADAGFDLQPPSLALIPMQGPRPGSTKLAFGLNVLQGAW